MPTRSPDILGLLTSRIDHMESNLATQIHDVREDLGHRLDDLNGRVAIQNGRVSTLEKCVSRLEVEVEADLNKPWDRRKMALIGTGGLIGGAGVIELVKWVGESLHRLGVFG